MVKITKATLFILFVFVNSMAFAQKKGDDFSNKIFNFQFIYNGQFPSGDWEKMYGVSHGLGFGVNYKTQTNWLFSAESSFMLSNNLKNTADLVNLTNSNNYTFNTNNGTPATVDLSMRGFTAFGRIGKIIPVNRLNKNHGFLVQIGAGYLMHYLNFNIPQNTVAQLNEVNQRGYDRLHGGLAISQFVGYYFHSESRLLNFYAGVDFAQAFTKNLREYNYDTHQYDLGSKQDNYTAFRFGWMIPIYLSSKSEEFNFKAN
ncbi:MAG: hypothetical protein ACOYMA_01085 [Bacteroidia bacterium]